MKTTYLYSVGEIVNETLIVIEQTRHKKDNNRKAYIVKSLVYPSADTYIATEANLKRGDGCKYKQGKAICKGNSLYDIESVRKYLIDHEEARKLTQQTRKKVDFKCPNCKTIKNMAVSNLVTQGLKCNVCSNKLSYAERFVIAYLELKDIKYYHQHKEMNLNKRIFDFYLPELDIYLECHGIQHYDKKNAWYNHSLEQDKDKRRWCLDNNKKLLELDCRISEFDYIKNKINDSLLPSIEKQETAKLSNDMKNKERYDVEKVIELYKKYKSSYKVADELNINDKQVRSILKRNNVDIFSRVKKIKCVNTGDIFNSAKEAAEWCGIKSRDSIAAVARGKQKKSGKHPETKEPLKWEYID